MDKYLNTKKAAEFCGYNHIYFGKLMEGYKMPRYGPKRNRFKQSDLEDWMKSPELFSVDKGSESIVNRSFRKVR
jgi:hypothetical protein